MTPIDINNNLTVLFNNAYFDYLFHVYIIFYRIKTLKIWTERVLLIKLANNTNGFFWIVSKMKKINILF